VLEKVRAMGSTLNELGAKPWRGTVSGYNEAFYVDAPTVTRLLKEDPKSQELIKPLLRGRDIDRWRPRESGMFVIIARRGININHYPAIKHHLSQFRERLEPKPESWSASSGKWLGRASGDYAWYELQASPSNEFIRITEAPKIVYQEIQFHSWFALDTSGSYPNNKVFMLPSCNLALLAVLNSPLMWWVLTRTLPHMKDEALTPAGFIMENLRVLLPSGALREKITDRATALCRLTDDRHAEEDRFLEKLASLKGGGPDRRALNWLRRPDDDFAAIVERSSPAPLSTAARRELATLKGESSNALARLLSERQRLEEELAVLVEDVYGLNDEERALLRSTRPVRDPLDVLRTPRG